MGHRASLVVITHQEPELYYSQWHATSLDAALFWGPEHATAFARSQNRQDRPHSLLLDAWAEGGAIIDHTRQQLLWYGGDDVRLDIPRRRLHLSLMERLWEGWRVRWATEGIAEIADYLQLPRTQVLSMPPPAEADASWAFEPPDDSSWLATVVSYSVDGTLGLRATDCGVPQLLGLGTALVSGLRKLPLRTSLDWEQLAPEFPTGGIHIDITRKTLEYWLAEDAPGLGARTEQLFPRWQTTTWGDAYERHIEACDGALRLPVPENAALLAALEDYLLQVDDATPAPTSSILNRLEADDGLDVPAPALTPRFSIPPLERRRLLKSILPAPRLA